MKRIKLSRLLKSRRRRSAEAQARVRREAKERAKRTKSNGHNG